MRKICAFQLWFCFAFVTLVYFQGFSQIIHFDNFTVTRGLSSNYVNAIDEDENGMLWIGTQTGLIKSDGSEFFKIPDSEGILNKEIFSVKVFDSKNVWIGFKQGVVVHYNGERYTEVLRSDNITYPGLFADSQNRLWISTDGAGLFLVKDPFLRSGGKAEIQQFGKKEGMPDHVHAVGEDFNKKLYFLTRPGIKMFNDSTGRFDFFRPGNFPNFTYYNIYSDSFHTYLGASEGIVMLGFDKQNKPEFKIYEGEMFAGITSITSGMNNDIWFATTTRGILKWNGSKFDVIDVARGLPGNKIRQLFTDSEGNIWIGHFENGLTAYRGSVFTSLSDFPDAGKVSVYSLFYDSLAGNLFVGADKGLYKIKYPAANGNLVVESVRKGINIQSIIDWDDRRMAVGTFGNGVLLINKRSNEVEQAFTGNSDQDFINRLHRYDENNLLVAHTKGLYLLNTDDASRKICGDLDDREVKSLEIQKDGTLWAGTESDGVYKLEGKYPFNIIRKLMDNVPVLSLNSLEPENLILEVGTSFNGLWQITDDHLQPSNPTGFKGKRVPFKTTHNKQIWMGSETGIYRYTATDAFPDVYDMNSGFTGIEIKAGSFAFLNKGYLALGTSDGILFLDAEAKRNFIVTPRLSISKAITSDSASFSNGSVLKYGNNSIRAYINAVSLSFPYSVTSAYKMDGYTEEWQDVNDNNQIYLQNIPEGSYVLKVRSYLGDNADVYSEDTLEFTVAPPFWKTIPFYLLVLLALFGGFRLVYRFNIRNALRKQQIRHEIEQRMKELEMKSLRSQMNPHFIFNSLQSIQNFLFGNNNTLANEYLLKFSKLMRLILENSQHDFVPMKSDLMALELYMQLESLRMPNPMKYAFHIDETIDPEQIAIPPLLLQPFVENAIWHGLHPKKTAGMIKISCSLHGKHLIFEIEDDGVGRSFIRDKGNIPGFKKESLGVKITEERIKILSESSQIPAGVEFEDLFDSENSPAGTRVRITIPFES